MQVKTNNQTIQTQQKQQKLQKQQKQQKQTPKNQKSKFAGQSQEKLLHLQKARR